VSPAGGVSPPGAEVLLCNAKHEYMYKTKDKM